MRNVSQERRTYVVNQAGINLPNPGTSLELNSTFSLSLEQLLTISGVKMYGEEYGSLTEWNDPLVHRWAYAGFPRAYANFLGQIAITNTLRDLVDAIVGDADGTGDSKWAAAASAGFRSSGSEALWSSYTQGTYL